MIPKETVDQINETARVEDVIGDFVNLKKRGANMLGLCPFHNEKTPSFTVSPTKGIYKCFGCGKAGGAVNFIMEHEQYTFPEALKYLANKYNIEIEEEELSSEQIQAANEKESLFIVTQFAAEYFKNQLWDTENGRAIGLSYFKERGFRDDIIETFKLGYSPDDWDSFTTAATEKGYQLDFLEKTGLTILKGEKKFDRFKGRVIFPIQNISGRVIGFGGRTLSADKKTAKYLNSPESDLYHKSKVLYGLNFAKKKIVENDKCYLVEGYTDVISFYQNDVQNVVASSGTSLTKEQIQLIKRYTLNINILFDGDTAGIKATFRGIDLILEEGMNVKVLAFPEGEDPDSFARSHGSNELKDYLKTNSKDFIRFKTELLMEESSNDPIKKAGLIKEIVNSIALIPEPIVRSVYIKDCSTLLNIEEQSLFSELNKIRRNRVSRRVKGQEATFDDIPVSEPISLLGTEIEQSEKRIGDTLSFQEEDIIHTLVKYGNSEINIPTEDENDLAVSSVSKYLISELEQDGFSFKNKLYQKIFLIFKESISEGQNVAEDILVGHEDKEISSIAIGCLMEKYTLSLNWEEKHKILTIREEDILPKKIHKGVCSWRLNKIQDMIYKKQASLKANPENYEEIYNSIIKLEEAKKVLAKELGRTILH